MSYPGNLLVRGLNHLQRYSSVLLPQPTGQYYFNGQDLVFIYIYNMYIVIWFQVFLSNTNICFRKYFITIITINIFNVLSITFKHYIFTIISIIFCTQRYQIFVSNTDIAQSAGTEEYSDWISTEGLDSSNECPKYDIKQSDGKAPVMLELWGMRTTPLLPLFPGPLCFGVVAPDKVLSMSQIKLTCVLALNWILKK